ncbi:MAG: hypothetical protein P9L93_08010 [Candidatus Gorgyraea atricola]|nr:hypothetical protein [Candidatus Gorgyraea atricola]
MTTLGRKTIWLRILITIAMIASYVIVPEPRYAYAACPWTQTTTADFNTDTIAGDAYVSGNAVYVKVPEDGEGDDGNVTISASKNINTDIIEAGRSYADGIVTAVSAISTNSVTVASINGFAAGDKALLINMQGSATYNGNVGKNEILDVSSAASTTVTFSTNIAKIYGASASNSDLTGQKIMLQRVPQYNAVTIQSGGSIICSAWNGTSGGVVAFSASGTVDIQSGGNINVDQKGFRTGDSSGPEGYIGRTATGGGTGGSGGCGGETSGGVGSGSTYGGGGGSSADATNGGSSTYGGNGGRGTDTGHATESTAGGSGSANSPGTGGGGGGCVYRPCAGGGGGSPYDSETNDSQSDLSKIMLGGGASKGSKGGNGGGTWDCNEVTSGTTAGGNQYDGGSGGAGGGMVIIKGGGTVTVAGNIYSRGGNGGGGGNGGNGGSGTYCYDGGGGGGGGGANGASGGSVLIYGDAVTLGTSLVVATAGSGGSGGSAGAPGQLGPNAKGGGSGGSGSTGSTGKIAVFYETSKGGSASPADGGTQQDINDGTGTITSTTVDFDDCSGAATYDEVSWNDTETNGDIKYQVTYWDGDSWELIPDGALTGNSSGFDTSPVDISALNTTTYNQIRLKATLTYSGGSPSLNDWTVSWITNAAPSTPTIALLFDNQKADSTTPAFKFTGTDPDSDNLDYEITWDDDFNFGSATTKSSSNYPTDAGWTAATFTSGTQVTYTVQAGDAFTNTSTYWWKVRTRDPGGLNTWSGWTGARSFTIDTSVTAPTWFQTTEEQFDTDTMTGSTDAQATDDVRMTGP